MNPNNLKIENFLKKQVNTDLKDIFIIDDGNGNFELFNEYLISKQSNGTYKVTHNIIDSNCELSSLKNAFTWCIFHKNKMFFDTKKIEELDLLLASINLRLIQQQKILSKIANLTDKLIYTAKIHENKVKKIRMLKELNSYINTSKYWQKRKFAEKLPK